MKTQNPTNPGVPETWQQKMNSPIVIEYTYNAPLEIIWKALTDGGEMRKWYFDLPNFKAEVGYEFQFLAGEDKDNQYLHICKVTEVVPGRKITYSWKYEGYDGISYVTFELLPAGNSTKVRLTHAGLDSFPKSNPDLRKENFVEGWNHILGKSLEEYVGKLAANH